MNQSFRLDAGVSNGQSSIPWGGQQQEAEAHQRNQLLLVLLQQQQQQEKQEQQTQALMLLQQQLQQQEQLRQPFMAAALAALANSSLPLAHVNDNNEIVAISRSILSASQELAKLTSQAMLYPGDLDLTQERLTRTCPTNESPRHADFAEPIAATNLHQDLQYHFEASKLMDPTSEEDDDDCAESEKEGSTSGLTEDATAREKFPCKLYRMLDEVENNGNGSVVSFFSHGRAFAVHKPRDFVADLMPKYFNTTRIASFQRQLLLYGFRRITAGRDKGGYFHEYFLRGRKGLCKKIRRKKSAVQNQSDSSVAKSNTGDAGNPGTAESENAVNQAILAQLNQQLLSQRVAPPTQHLTQESIEFILGGSAPFRTRPGIPAAIVDASTLLGASERLGVERQHYDLLHPLLFAPQLQPQDEGAAPEQARYGENQEY